MKSLYIISFLALSINIYAQQEKAVSEIQEAPYYKESKELEAKMMKEAQEKALQKPSSVALASEQGLEVKKETAKKETSNSSGKLLPNTASFEEILATIPGRQPRKTNITRSTNNNIKGLISSPDLTLEDIKKTIPKN
ncbi:hypothetical protein PFY12_09945 [Chryseobacterium camelliae]|uniref:Uncharacterized protein n=1 Tax=Chryseobacterium camelliae TaxID=1265445 RepID=A0ABY7QL34_9FLAO|nr:hypothetical protein [Chryseobacterium camelliae]WBV59378.1 hypothetical protein PFY12_09945 [Chryseobacterium camelliae]